MIEVAPVAPAEWADHAPMTYPAYRHLPRALPAETVALAATAFGRPAGLLLAQHRAGGIVELLSVFVVPAWRRQGVAEKLLAALEAAARGAGAQRLAVIFSRPQPGGEALEKLLRRAGWGEPRLRMLIAEGSLRRFMQEPWLRRPPRLPAGCEIFSWSELTAAERARLQAGEGQLGWHGPELSPFAIEPAEPETSVGLRWRGEVAGWAITHRIVPGYLRYSSLFVHASCRPLGLGIPLIATAIRRHAAASFAQTDDGGLFNVALDNRRMIRLLQGSLQPLLISLKRSYGAEKLLLPSGVSVPS